MAPDPVDVHGISRPDHPTVESLIRHRLGEALGGLRGSVETALPMIVFVICWSATSDRRISLGAAGGVTLVLAIARLVQRQTLQFVLSSLFATGLAAFFALRSGQAQDAFLPGILTSAAYAVGALVSILTRWPLLGFVVAIGDPDYAEHPAAWRRDEGLVRVCARLTWVLFGLFVIRVAIMLPLYLAGEVAWLGVTKIALGWPAYLLAVVAMGAMLATGRTPQTDDCQDDVTERMEQAHLEREREVVEREGLEDAEREGTDP